MLNLSISTNLMFTSWLLLTSSCYLSPLISAPIEFDDTKYGRHCRAEDATDLLVRCVPTGTPLAPITEPKDIWEAVIKCNSQSPTECHASIGRFKEQIQATTPLYLMPWKDLWYLGNIPAEIITDPLKLAAVTANVNAAKALLAHGANPNATVLREIPWAKYSYDEYGPLHALVNYVGLLSSSDQLHHSAKIEVPAHEFGGGPFTVHHTPMGPRYTEKRGKFLEIAKLLTLHGADLKFKQGKNWFRDDTPAEMCAAYYAGDQTLCQFLRCAEKQPASAKLINKCAAISKFVQHAEKHVKNLDQEAYRDF
ncbi:MAG TPA: hypothetical protein VJJ83_01155 [Candidatus Babeliales bacterium]|nr:hypothetical protein [Candidatus Babeliales bacterium]